MISFYDLLMKPLEKRGIKKARQTLIPLATGTVLEIGAGTGANLELYQMENIDKLIVSDIELSNALTTKSKTYDVHLTECTSSDLPFPDNIFDYVVHTLVFCTVADVDQSLEEIKRVLKDDGHVIFIEHVLPKKKRLRRTFTFINPFWKKIASGCHLTRQYKESLLHHNFEIKTIDSFMNDVFIYGIAKPKRKAV